jgi:transcriptional regulator with XRE-family HTH domain
MLNSIFFKTQLDKRGLTQIKLAELLDLSKTAISLKLSGKRKFTLAEITKLAQIFNITREEVMTNLGYEENRAAPKRTSVKISGFVNSDGSIMELDGEHIECNIAGAVSAVKVLANNIYSGFLYILGSPSTVNASPLAVISCADARYLCFVTTTGFLTPFTLQSVKHSKSSSYYPVLAIIPKAYSFDVL